MKRLLFTLVIVMAYGISNAQLFKVFGHEVGYIYVGPRLGMNFSKFSDFNGTYEKSRFGYEFGAVGEFGFTTRFSIQTELMFLSKGSRDENFGKIRMNYIGIPILAKYGFRALGRLPRLERRRRRNPRPASPTCWARPSANSSR